MTQLHLAPFFSACNRPDLLLGCDRRLFILLVCIMASLVVSSFTLFWTLVAVVLFFVCLKLFRRMAIVDAQLVDIYQRHIGYRRYYPANSDVWKVNSTYDRARWCGSAKDNL